ncbi:9e23051e-1790-4241-84b5-8628ab20d573 [Thermothielavioides terrestris]|uniref:9e23051e-1790-4241-84b5-8628ab20d573 n=1 Tax=Thermothielavioides terrestris TaxID=2587410 RepID=A0A3S4C8V8_9PEZI|nr:9e23051e-1790-4241-84b5-8628ab20d573 [Thermothielavioides terrestris]
MDPVSITTGALGLAKTVLDATALIRSAVDNFRDAAAVARDIEDEVLVIQASLRQIETALTPDPWVVGRLGLGHIFEISVEGCLEILQAIDAEFWSLHRRDDWRARLEIWWKEGDIRRLLGRLDRKKGALMLLVQALNLRSVLDLQVLLHQNQSTLDLARLGLDDMVPSYPAIKGHGLDSVASELCSNASLLGDRESLLSDTRFAFDGICFGSKAYAHAVARVTAEKKKGNRTDPTSTETRPDDRLESVNEKHGQLPEDKVTPIIQTGVDPAIHEAASFDCYESSKPKR